MIKRGQIGTLAVRMLCALALLFLGLAHKMPAISASSDSLLLQIAYSLPDGSAPDLCLPQGKSDTKSSLSDCDACRLSGSTVLPSPPVVKAVASAAVPADTFPLVAANVARSLPSAHLARGPPLSLVA